MPAQHSPCLLFSVLGLALVASVTLEALELGLSSRRPCGHFPWLCFSGGHVPTGLQLPLSFLFLQLLLSLSSDATSCLVLQT